MPGGIGGMELILIFLIVLLVFGPKKIPEVARGIGKGIREVRKLSTEMQREMNLAEAVREAESGETPKAGKESLPTGIRDETSAKDTDPPEVPKGMDDPV